MASGKITSISSRWEFKWEINNFEISNKVVGDYFESPKYTAYCATGNVKWYLRLYPKGEKETAENHVSLYLYANPAMIAIGSLKIVSSTGKVLMAAKSTGKTFFNNYGLGFPKLVGQDFLANPAHDILTKGGRMIIICEVNMFYPHQEICSYSGIKRKFDEIEEPTLPRLKVLDEYETLFNEGRLSDVTLISEGRAVKAHKCILGKSSSVFAAMFEVVTKDIVDVDDVRPDILLEMIRFIYVGKVCGIDGIAGELATAADKYALDRLKTTCEKTMTKNLSVENVVDSLQLADKLRMVDLKEQAVEFIVENAAVITKKAEFELLPADVLRKVCCGLAKRNR